MTDEITIKKWYYGANYHLEQLSFADGSSLSAARAQALASAISGTEGEDSLIGLATILLSMP